ncbi:MAG: carbohydrate kinase family protein [Clostridiales bacterium]|nr:carbohydrate kinase family protein [Clostridiales bacterium]
MRKGIAVAGNMIVDHLKVIRTFPQRNELVKIDSMSYTLGGAVNNVAQDLARLDPELPLSVIGMVGCDAEGDAILRTLGQYKNIDLSRVVREGQTSTTDVLSEEAISARTFLMFPGASALLGRRHFDLDNLDCALFYIGYILLLDELDAPDDEYGTQMAHLLHDVKARGIPTAVDVVSEVGDRFARVVPPSLPYTDYLVVNEIEGGRTAGIELRDGGDQLLIDRVPEALAALKRMGVGRWAVIHAPEGGFGIDERGQYVAVPGARLPRGFIAGTVGAGDAFCAGVLHAAWRGDGLTQAIEDGIACAVSSLRAANASDGVMPLSEMRGLLSTLPRRALSR